MSNKPNIKSQEEPKTDLKGPDEFQEYVAKAADFFKVYGTRIGIGAVVIVVGIVATVLIVRGMKSSDVKTANEFSKAFAPIASQILPDPSKEGAPTADKAAIESIRKSVAEFAEKNKGKEIEGLARVAEGIAALQAGDFTGSADVLKACVENTGIDDGLRSIAWQAYAAAADGAGRREEAVKAYEEMTKSTSQVAKAWGFMYLGDMFNPAMKVGDQPVDAAKAKEYYDKGTEALSGDEAPSPDKALVLNSIKARVAGLK